VTASVQRRDFESHYVRFISLDDLDVFCPRAVNAFRSTGLGSPLLSHHGIASTVLVFLAFARTFYLKPYFGTPQLSRLVELHGIVFTSGSFFSSRKLLSLPRIGQRFIDGLATRAEY
jgi:hypothetical protein